MNSSDRKVSDNSKAELLRDVLTTLERAGHKLCVVHVPEGFPEHIESDVDAFSGDPPEIPRILSQHNVATTVQVFQHEATAFYYILCRRRDGTISYLALDVSSDFRSDGRIWLKGRSEDFLKACRPCQFFHAPPSDLGFILYLLKRVGKKSLGEGQIRELQRLYDEDPRGCDRWLVHFFPPEQARSIAGAARRRDWKPVQLRVDSLRRATLRKTRRERPLQVLQYWLHHFWRGAKRILRPTGLMVVFLGADGSGKSTVADQVKQKIAPAFRSTMQCHLRPSVCNGGGTQVTNGGGTQVTDPHAQPLRGLTSSLVKLAYWWVVYTLGYLTNVYPRLARSTLVLFDRYYHDILVDARRYRYGGPLWLARLTGKVIPRPHLVILLDAPPAVLFARKQEVPFEEVNRQREEYVNLVGSLPEGHIVDASKPLVEVVAEVEKILLDYIATRTAYRMGLDEKRGENK
jgi:thymidylate kinase